MTANPAAEVFCLTNIDHFTLLVMEIIYAGGIWNGSDLFGWQVGREVLFPAFPMQHVLNRTLGIPTKYFFEKDDRCIRVTPCPVSVQDRYFKLPAKLTQAISLKSRKNFPAEANRTKFIGIQIIPTGF